MAGGGVTYGFSEPGTAETRFVVVARLGATTPLPQYGIVRLSLEWHST